jgi:hypothetical protein
MPTDCSTTGHVSSKLTFGVVTSDVFSATRCKTEGNSAELLKRKVVFESDMWQWTMEQVWWRHMVVRLDCVVG